MPFKRLLPFLLPLALLFSCTPTNEFTLVLQNKTNQPDNEALYLNELSGALTRTELLAISDNAQSTFKGDTAGTVSFKVSFNNIQYSGTTPMPLEINESYMLTFRYNSATTPPLLCTFTDSDSGIQNVVLTTS
jgi:hypothetical protein